MTSKEIRQQFLSFFESKNHKIVHSAPVVPFDDPTLLFTNAGMNQFKDVFLATGNRDYKRAADSQKCIRVSGKHNDLEEVGYDTYHHTFFEMLGNWSFGDYYKTEAIQWAWELLTDVWKLPKDRLFVTVYRTDDEAFNIWKNKTDINPKHILRFDEKDNFWEMGETGPCGPCSEIHVNLSEDNNPLLVNAGVPECIEVWNLVFIQYNRDVEGNLHELPAKHVDTGMGFERMCAVLQNKKSNYDTDVFSPIIKDISKLSHIPYEVEENKVAMRVIADHLRTLTFAITDGAVPGNDGRGYVLRRILRRAARYGRKLNLNRPFLFNLVDSVINSMGDVYPEIVEKKDYVIKVIKGEEESFNTTLDRGIELFTKIAESLESESKTMVTGDDVFKLYDTYGFPVDLTAIMARERGLTIDEIGFNVLMEKQRETARESSKDKFAAVGMGSDTLSSMNLTSQEFLFTGYDELNSKSIVTGVKEENGNIILVLDKSPFYVESGGQTNDKGKIIKDGKEHEILDAVKVEGKVFHYIANNKDVTFSQGDIIEVHIDEDRRMDIMRNHSATHLLNAALRKTLGTHIQQAGSYVGPDRLRFDFTHFAKVTKEELKQIEHLVNRYIRKAVTLHHHRNIDFDEAKNMGALMFFGDKYGDKVNIIQFGDSLEFCGGTHVPNTAVIGMFKILSESSISSGVRRIEAVTGSGVEKFIEEQENHVLDLEEKITSLNEAKRKLEKEIAEINLKNKLSSSSDLLSNFIEVKGIKVCQSIVQVETMDELKSFGDDMRNKIKSGVGVLTSEVEGKVSIVCVVSDDLIKDKKLSAGKIVGDLAKIVGGGGGGRPHLATAGGKDTSKLQDMLDSIPSIIDKYL